MLFNVTGLTVKVSIFTLISMWAAAMYICMCSIHILKGGGDSHEGGQDSPPLALCRKKNLIVLAQEYNYNSYCFLHSVQTWLLEISHARCEPLYRILFFR